jgi:hypothetical protein
VRRIPKNPRIQRSLEQNNLNYKSATTSAIATSPNPTEVRAADPARVGVRDELEGAPTGAATDGTPTWKGALPADGTDVGAADVLGAASADGALSAGAEVGAVPPYDTGPAVPAGH